MKVIPLTEASSFIASYISEIFLLFCEKLKHSCCLYSVRAFYVHSNQHVPGFITQAEQLKAKGVDEILLISVNDPFVMKAWAKTYPENKHVKFLADGSGAYTKALDLELDLTDKGLGVRSKRFALLADDLTVTVANIEEGGQFTISGAEEILKAL